jgi:hypothetical protein
VLLMPVATLPGRLSFGTLSGSVAGRSVVTARCTTTLVGAARSSIRPAGRCRTPTDDGTVDFNLDLDLGFARVGGEPPIAKLITLTGSSMLATTSTSVCPGVNQSPRHAELGVAARRRPGAVHRLGPTARRSKAASPSPLPGGYTLTSVWKFTAVRE